MPPPRATRESAKTVAKIEKCRRRMSSPCRPTEGIDFFFHCFIGFGRRCFCRPGLSSLPEQGEAVRGNSVFYRHDEDGR